MSGYGAGDLAEFSARLAQLRASQSAASAGFPYVAYTDGACLGNPSGPGGWAAVVFPAETSAERWLLFGHLSSTSNNRAEALGVLAALEWIPPGSALSLHSDSELTIRLLQGRYKIKANTDIWDIILRTRLEKQLDLTYEWVRGHAGDPLNELADRLANLGALNRSLADLGAIEIPSPPDEPSELVGLAPRTDWEREFLTSVTEQLRRGRSLSPKQQAVVDRMRARGETRSS